jgi:hypothetical protein
VNDSLIPERNPGKSTLLVALIELFQAQYDHLVLMINKLLFYNKNVTDYVK